MKFKFGRSNMAITVYVPYDCENTCPFCTSKKEYAKTKMDFEAVKAALQQAIKIPGITDVVFTGGEPTADIHKLYELIEIAKHKNVYVNTTLPQKNFFGIQELCDDGDITGINISRHATSFSEDCKLFHNIVDDWAFKGISVPIKVNAVITDKTTIEDVKAIIDRWKDDSNVTVCFRRDFRKTTPETLHAMSGDNILDYLFDNYEFASHGFCDVCDTVKFVENIAFHRGLEKSSLKVGNTVIINDIIIFPDGFVAYDWDKKPISDLDGLIPTAASAKKAKKDAYFNEAAQDSSKPKKSDDSVVFTGSSCGVRQGCGLPTIHPTKIPSSGCGIGSSCGISYSSCRCGSFSGTCG